MTARVFAEKAHGNQQYGLGEPYVVHLDAVASLVSPYGEIAQTVAYLHDVVEDTSVSLEDIAKKFGSRVALFVGCVTDCDGLNRKERKLATNAKLSMIPPFLNIALVVKVADRLANTRACIAKKSDLLKMYHKEHPAFKAAVWREGLAVSMWEELDRLMEE